MNCRTGEKATTHFRNERFYNVDSHWFFSTREKIEFGPFDTRAEAQNELILFIRHVGEGGLYEQMYKLSQ